MARKMKRNVKMLRLLAKDFLLKNPSASNYEVTQAIRCSERTVTQARQELIRAGLLIENPNSHIRTLFSEYPTSELLSSNEGLPDEEKLEITAAAELMKEVAKLGDIEDLDNLDVNEMRRRLTRIAKNPKIHPQIQIMAMKEKRKLDLEGVDRHSLGPGPPMTKEGALDRLSLMFEACGLPLVLEALEKTFKIGGESGEEKTMDARNATLQTPATPDAQASESSVHSVENDNSTHQVG